MGQLKVAKPQAVIIELGGPDYLKGHSRAATADNLKKIIDACQSVGADVVLMELPRGFITDPFCGLERELARQYDLELIADTSIRNLVLWSAYSPPGMWCNAATHLSDVRIANLNTLRPGLSDIDRSESLRRLIGSQFSAGTPSGCSAAMWISMPLEAASVVPIR